MRPIDYFYRTSLSHPDGIAAVMNDTQVTYADLKSAVESLAAGLQVVDPNPGSRVGICSFNSIEHLSCWLAVMAAGKGWVPLYPKTGQAELSRIATFTEASIILSEENFLRHFEDTAARVITMAEGDGDTTGRMRQQHLDAVPSETRQRPEDTQAIKFTGGSTGVPKGVMQPLRAWTTNIETQIEVWDMKPGERTLLAAPFTHGTGTYIYPTLGSGGTLVILDQPTPAETLYALAEHEITTVFLPPTVIYLMMALPDAGKTSFPALRNLIYGAGPMRPEAIEKASAIFGATLASTYGQTEAPQVATTISASELMQPELRASVGRATQLTDVQIMDEQGRVLPPGEVGEIVFKGDLVMTGYWKQPEKTAETIRDGWLRTGDLGLIDEDGFVFIKGRSKDMVISGGFNIYPADVEPVLGKHPAVQDCAVFGTEDEKWGEALHAAVEVRPGMSVDEAELQAHVRAELGPVQTPKSIAFYDALPRNAYGKLQKQTLIEDRRAASSKEDSS